MNFPHSLLLHIFCLSLCQLHRLKINPSAIPLALLLYLPLCLPTRLPHSARPRAKILASSQKNTSSMTCRNLSDRDTLMTAAGKVENHATAGSLLGLGLGLFLAFRFRSRRVQLFNAFRTAEKPTHLKFADGTEGEDHHVISVPSFIFQCSTFLHRQLPTQAAQKENRAIHATSLVPLMRLCRSYSEHHPSSKADNSWRHCYLLLLQRRWSLPRR